MQVSFVPSGAKWRTLFISRGLGLLVTASCLFMLAACSNPTGWMQGLGGEDDSDSPLPPPLIADEEGVVPDPRERRKAAQVPTGLRAATPPAPGNQEEAETAEPQYMDDSLRGGQTAAAAPPRVLPPVPTSKAPPVPEVNKVPAVPQPPVAQAPISPPAIAAQKAPPPPPAVLPPATAQQPPSMPPALQPPPPPIAAAKPAPVPPAPAASAPARTAPPASGTRSDIASVIPQTAPVPPGQAPSSPAVQKLPGYPPTPAYGANTPPAGAAMPAQPMPLPPSAPIAQSGLAPQPPRPMQMPPPVTAMQVPPLGTPEAETLPPVLTPAPPAQSAMTPNQQWQQPPAQWQAPAAARPGWQMAEQPSLAQFAAMPSGLIETVYFKSGSANLDSQDRQKIRAAAEKYKQRRGGIIRVLGHASSRTQNMTEVKQMMTNWEISQRRAAVVADELIRAGVAPEAIVVEAVSDREPIYVESLPAGEAGNRRAEIYLE